MDDWAHEIMLAFGVALALAGVVIVFVLMINLIMIGCASPILGCMPR